MGIKARRKVYQIGKSKALSIPHELNTGEEHTMAADFLILSDPTGKISPELLYQWLQEIEEKLYEYRKQEKQETK